MHDHELSEMATHIIDCQYGYTTETCNDYLREFDASIESLFVNNQDREHEKNK